MLSTQVPSEPHFVWRARHSVVPALSLPVYIPDDMAHQLNKEFGQLLRDRIIKLMPANFKTGRARVDTTSSERLSVDSTKNEYVLTHYWETRGHRGLEIGGVIGDIMDSS